MSVCVCVGNSATTGEKRDIPLCVSGFLFQAGVFSVALWVARVTSFGGPDTFSSMKSDDENEALMSNWLVHMVERLVPLPFELRTSNERHKADRQWM